MHRSSIGSNSRIKYDRSFNRENFYFALSKCCVWSSEKYPLNCYLKKVETPNLRNENVKKEKEKCIHKRDEYAWFVLNELEQQQRILSPDRLQLTSFLMLLSFFAYKMEQIARNSAQQYCIFTCDLNVFFLGIYSSRNHKLIQSMPSKYNYSQIYFGIYL